MHKRARAITEKSVHPDRGFPAHSSEGKKEGCHPEIANPEHMLSSRKSGTAGEFMEKVRVVTNRHTVRMMRFERPGERWGTSLRGGRIDLRKSENENVKGLVGNGPSCVLSGKGEKRLSCRANRRWLATNKDGTAGRERIVARKISGTQTLVKARKAIARVVPGKGKRARKQKQGEDRERKSRGLRADALSKTAASS